MALAFWELALLVWLVVTICLLIVWVGVYLVPGALDAITRIARSQRRMAGRWSGTEIADSYRPLPEGRGLANRWRRVLAQLRDGAVWRDLLWVLVDPVVGLVIVLFPLSLMLYTVWGLVLLAIWRPVVDAGGTQWFMFVPVSDERTARIAAGVGVVFGIVGWFLVRPAAGLHAAWVRLVLSPSAASLERRVAELSQSRANVVDDASAEVRRIERDLHDGAQARIAAVGMNLAAAERLIEDDPAAARVLLAEAKESSSAALRELRELVRGIHPPVLADRGLVDAVRSLAIELPVPVTVNSTLVGRLSAPVESAVYFAVSELLANVVKHARATAVTVDVRHEGALLTVEVRDDGVGGAEPSAGTGLRGIERRLGAFDGTVHVASPAGGPTVVTIRVPAAVADI